MKTLPRILLFTALLGLLALQPARAQADYPNRPVRLVVPWTTGGFNDVLARLVAEKMSQSMGQPVIVDNRPGATGTMGSESVARAPADGHTLLMATADTHAISSAVFPKLRYDPIRDFTPVSLLASQPVVIWVGENVPAKNLAEFVQLAKAKQGNASYGSIGVGSTTHLGMELFLLASNSKMIHVPFKGSGPALIEVLGGRIDAVMLTFGGAGAHASSGKLRPLAITSPERYSVAPAIPTVAESGYPDFSLALWNGIVVPKGTPTPIVDRLHRELKAALQAPDVKEKLAGFGVEPIGSSPAEFTDFIRVEVAKWGSAAKAAKVQLD